MVTTWGLSHGALMALADHPDGGVLNGRSQAVPEDGDACHRPISLHTHDRVPQSHGPWASINVPLPTVSFTDEWKVRQTCVSHGTGGGLVLIEATPTLWARPRCSHHERLISSTVRAFHHIMGPNPGRFASHYGSQPSSPSPRQTPACLQDEKLSKLLGVGCT